MPTALSADGGHSAAILARGLAALSAGRSRFLGGELVSRAFLVGRLAALAAGLLRLFRAELMGRSLGVSGLPTFAGDLSLPHLIHRAEAPLAAWHLSPPFNRTCVGTAHPPGDPPFPRARNW